MYVYSLHAESALLRIQLRQKEEELNNLRLQLSQLSRGHASAFNADSKDRTSVPEGASSDSESSVDSESSDSRELLGKFVKQLSQKVCKHPTPDECSSSSSTSGSSSSKTQLSSRNSSVTSGFRSSSSPSCSCSSGTPRSSCCNSSVKPADLNQVEMHPSFQTIARQLTQNMCKQARSEALQDSPSCSTRQPHKQPEKAQSRRFQQAEPPPTLAPSETEEGDYDPSDTDPEPEPDGSSSSSSPSSSTSNPSTFRGQTARVLYLNVCFNQLKCMILLVENIQNKCTNLTYKTLLPSIILVRYFQVAACRQGSPRQGPLPVQSEAQIT